MNEGKVPETWDQLWAVVRVMAQQTTNIDDLRTLEQRWRRYRAEALNTPTQLGTAEVLPARVVVGKIPDEPPCFIVRPQLQQLREELTRSRIAVVVTGMRGAGKTQLAAAHAREILSSDAELVGWVNAESAETLYAGLAEIAIRMGIAEPNADAVEMAHRLRGHLSGRTSNGLLILDNATNPDLVQTLIPTHGTHVVITSTDRAFTRFGAAVDAQQGFTRQESLEYLGNVTRLNPETGADQLAQELGDLPLALAAEAATIVTRHLSYASYLILLRGPKSRSSLGSTSPSAGAVTSSLSCNSFRFGSVVSHSNWHGAGLDRGNAGAMCVDCGAVVGCGGPGSGGTASFAGCGGRALDARSYPSE
ncbi:hypothetical protein [Nocardia sp. NPDC005825]|uniref:hypothetical protein n=1 Tax=Nocardia sp. NPDC005825 TaxID=3155452 RepID=UPI0033CD5D4D